MRKNSYDKSVIVAAILSINDGLVSNFLLMMTVAGSSMSIKNILITGISGVLAGAISMGVGTWRAVSVTQKKVRSSKELITSLTDNVDDTTETKGRWCKRGSKSFDSFFYSFYYRVINSCYTLYML